MAEMSVGDFLAEHGLAGAKRVALAGDASARRYWRLPGHGLLVMEHRADPRSVGRFALLSTHLQDLGLSTPEVKGLAGPLALIEDFGDATYTDRLNRGRDPEPLYSAAVDALLALHGAPATTAVDRPVLDLDAYIELLDLFSDWFAPAVAPPDFDRVGFAETFRMLWASVLTTIAGREETLVLRDFHAGNLIHLPERDGVRQVGLLDFQDAVIGPREFDLVSLLQDARRDIDPGLEERMTARYAAGRPGAEAEIRRRYPILAGVRHCRVLAVFTRLWLRDGKAGYLRHMDRVAGQLSRALATEDLAEIGAFLDESLPGWETRAADLGR
ncbi:MAG: phosphotransferase [Pseudomonadota bacterium]